MINKYDMFFVAYESMQVSPQSFQWTYEPKCIAIPPEEFLHMGELVTLDETTKEYHKKTYVLTKHFLYKCIGSCSKDLFDVVSKMEFRSPNIKKVEDCSKEL
eukprot:TRINITY_DN4000_c0_g1_i5.p2 TRINITY_DN4000_c0_g1~~TRINITY_DN4000_c0_g1_i5.p2  ORF type:complete len:102 (+),score=23.08 TRINITY_DN4000_c0_g1_i5:82-387(+)